MGNPLNIHIDILRIQTSDGQQNFLSPIDKANKINQVNTGGQLLVNTNNLISCRDSIDIGESTVINVLYTNRLFNSV